MTKSTEDNLGSSIITKRLNQIFEWLKAFHLRKSPAIRQISEQKWHFNLSNLPNHHSIHLQSTPELLQDFSKPLLRITRPTLTACPKPPEALIPWINKGWENPKEEPSHKESINVVVNNETTTLSFENNSELMVLWKKWLKQRNAWLEAEKPALEAARVYEKFCELYSLAIRENEECEVVLGEGLLNWRQPSGGVHHPLMLRLVEVTFDSKKQTIEIFDKSSETTLYTNLLHELEQVDFTLLKTAIQDLQESDYHPLENTRIRGFLRSLITLLNPVHGEFTENPNDGEMDHPRMWPEPYLFVRLKESNIIGFVSTIMESLQTAQIPEALQSIVCDELKIVTTDEEGPVVSMHNELSDDKMYLAHPANKEQKLIIRHLEKSSMVVVQGPPGTGKTHTIGNLIGHLLAQGKRILITSHTAKALRVLKDKIPLPLQSLCVPIFDSGQKGRRELELAVQGISKKLTQHPEDLFTKASALEKRRTEKLEKIRDLRERLRIIISNDYNHITYKETKYLPSEAAQWLTHHREGNDWIPGDVIAAQTLQHDQLSALYAQHDEITAEEEHDASLPLPDINQLPTTEQVSAWIKEQNELQAKTTNEGLALWGHSKATSTELEQIHDQIVKEFKDVETWRVKAIEDGLKDMPQAWERFIALADAVTTLDNQIVLDKIHDPVLPQSLVLTRQIDIATEILAYLNKNGALGFLQKLFKSEWNTFIKESTVNGKSPQKQTEFEILLRAATQKHQIKEFEILKMHLFDNTQNLQIQKVAGEIRKCLNWPNTVWQPLQAQFLTIGLNLNQLLPSSSFSNYTTIRTTMLSLTSILTQQAQRNRIIEIQQSLKHTIDSLAPFAAIPPSQKLCEALKNEDMASYAKYLSYINYLTSIKSAVEKRMQALSVIKQIAPEWANAIHKRIPPHHASKLPGDLSKAWQWAAMNTTLNERLREDSQELLEQIEQEEKTLQFITMELVDNLAWGIQIQRINNSPQIRNDLQAWTDHYKKAISQTNPSFKAKLNAEAKHYLSKASNAVPVWIMPLSEVFQRFDPTKSNFDVLIIDEASQADTSALAAMYLAKKVVIVGDNEQVTPDAVGIDAELIRRFGETLLQGIPGSTLYDGKQSIYDLCQRRFGKEAIRLVEHFRCVPEIIAFSNKLSYEGSIVPLRESNGANLKPACIPINISGRRDGKINHAEANMIVSLILAMLKNPTYNGKTIGVISMLGDHQARTIQDLLMRHIDDEERTKRRIICGNSAQFQGDERDIILISLVDDANDGGIPLTFRGESQQDALWRKRYNVAASRARDQMWVIHSIDMYKDLQAGDIRRDFLLHAYDPAATMRNFEIVGKEAESEFELQVLKRLVTKGYKVIPQQIVGNHRIDIVVQGKNSRLAVECDGDRWHPLEKLEEDLERQKVLERAGWRFVRLRGGEFFRNPEKTLEKMWKKLDDMGIEPEEGEIASQLDIGASVADVLIAEAKVLCQGWQCKNPQE